MLRTLSLSLALLATPALAVKVPANLPQPEAGLWEIKTSVAEMGGAGMTLETCMDGKVEELLKRPEVEEAQCTDMEFDYHGNRLTGRGTCTIEGSRVDIESELTGDFRRAYSGQIRSTYTPPLHGMHKHTATVDGRWVAPNCHPGQQPGDSRIKGGVNVPGLGNIDLEGLMQNLPSFPR